MGSCVIECTEETFAVSITEISMSGCRLLGNCSNLRTGDNTKVTIGNLGPLEAVVRWANDEAAGVEFVDRLEEAVAAHFAVYCRTAA